MRRKNRQVNIYSVSALDLFASAMGVFLIIAVISLPYYVNTNKISDEKIKKISQENRDLQEKIKKLSKDTFCVIKMEWTSENAQDVDLYVTDNVGNVFFYKQPRVESNKDAALTVDAGFPRLSLQGTEVWISKRLKEGTYTIEYVFAKGVPPLHVKGEIITKTFTKTLPIKTFIDDKKIKVATINVDSSGEISVESF